MTARVLLLTSGSDESAAALAAHLPHLQQATAPTTPAGWRALWRSARPAVVHAFGGPAARAAAVLRVPTVLTAADRDGGWLTRLVSRRAAVVAATRAEAARLAAAGWSRVRVIPPGVPPPAAVDRAHVLQQLGVPSTARVIVAAGRFDADAALRNAVWAFDVLKYVRPDLYLLLAGDGPERRRVEAFARRLGFDDYRVRFLGDVPPPWAVADVAWVTHRLGGVGHALQALAAGKPLVAADTPELAEIVRDLGGVTTVPFDDNVRRAAATHALLDHPPPSPADVVSRFPVAAMVNAYAAVYDELAGTLSPSPARSDA